MNSQFKKRLKRGDLLVGTIVTLASTEMAEIFCLSGFDWLFVDLEHSSLSVADAQHLLQVVTQKIPCTIRVPTNDEVWIKKVLDTGASGVVSPQIRTAMDAERVVQLCKYPPEGTRSVGIARAHGYGGNFDSYISSANESTAVIVQIEHIDAVNNIEQILEVSGIDCLFVGPYDLSGSMGKIGRIADTHVQEAISHVSRCAGKANVPLGIFAATPEAAVPYIQTGYNLIAVGIDTLLIRSASERILHTLKDLTQGVD